MDAVEHLVAADQKQVGRPPSQYRQVVAGRDGHELPAAARGALFPDPPNQVELTGHADGILAASGARALGAAFLKAFAGTSDKTNAMQLLAEQLGEILRALGDTRVPKRRAEKRSFFRIGARYRILIRHGASTAEAWLRDVSARGVGIVVPHGSPPVGAMVTLELPRQDGSIACITCIVRNAVQSSPAMHQVGASFVLPITQVRESLAALRVVAMSA